VKNSDALELAKQGSPKAIAALLNGQLRTKGVTALVTKDKYFGKEERLKIIFEYDQAKSKEKILAFTQSFFQKINPESISSAMIYGRRKGNDASDWSGEINLSQVDELKEQINFVSEAVEEVESDRVKLPKSESIAKGKEGESKNLPQIPKDKNERLIEASLISLQLLSVDGNKAIEMLNKAIEDFPEHLDFYYDRAVRYFSLDDKPKALIDCLNVLSKEPSHINAQMLEIQIKASLKLFDEVLGLTNSFIDHLSSVDGTDLKDADKDSKLSVAFFYRGFCKAHIENFENSLEDLRQSVLLDSKSEVYKGAIEMIKNLEELSQDIGNESMKILNLSMPEEEYEIAIRAAKQSEEVKLKSDVGLDFSRLQHLLKKQKFRQADKLTYDLMCKAMGKPIDSWFTEQDFQFFPEADLLTIDRLWTVYSNGKFGLSAQRRIYEECGGLFGGDNFTNRVGWESNPMFGQDFFADEEMLDYACEGFLPYLCNAKGKFLFVKNQFIYFAIQQRFKEVS